MIADLHVHTRYSDGSYTIEAALALARSREISCVSFVDHDTTAGTDKATALGLEAGILVLPGVEISAYDFRRQRKVHMLGYCYRRPASNIEALCGPVLAARDELTRWQTEAIARDGFDLSIADVEAAAYGSMALYKQHIMVALCRKDLADGVYSPLYRRLFKGGGVADREITYVDAFDAMAAIKADGGIAVLAHPGQLDSFDLAEDLAAEGLDGIELYHEDHSSRDHARVFELARRHPHLILTGGSDDHGSYGSLHTIGEIRSPFGAERKLLGRSSLSIREGLNALLSDYS